MRVYNVRLKIDASDEITEEGLREWIHDALGPAARIDSLALIGRLASGDDCADLLFSMPPERVTLTEGDVLIFRFKEHVRDEVCDALCKRIKEVFGDKFKALILESGAEMAIGEIVEKEGAGG